MKMRNISTRIIFLCFTLLDHGTFAFCPSIAINYGPQIYSQIPITCKSLLRMRESDEEDIDFDNFDWRAFRAQLVMNENVFHPSIDTNKNLQWAYNQGQFVEKGSIILAGVEQEYGFGLRQQYFQKSAILITEHNSDFTKGIILNRPSTSSIITDEYRNEWNIWFGGGSQNLNHHAPEILCLHTMEGEGTSIYEHSTSVVDRIQSCSFEDAKKMVDQNIAKQTDFYCFAGHTMWGKGQLETEINEGSWIMCAADGGTIAQQLAEMSKFNKHQYVNDGVDMWETLMSMIGKGDTVLDYTAVFEDLMLKEWVKDNLSFGGDKQRGGNLPCTVKDSSSNNILLPIIQGMVPFFAADTRNNVEIGSLVRAPSNERSPYLLNDQILHKALVLYILDNEDVSVGIIINQPTKQEIALELTNPDTGEKYTEYMPIRFGGPHAQDAEIWLHCNPKLRKAAVGKPIGQDDGFWNCTEDVVIDAINSGLAVPSDFLVVAGLSTWEKGGISGANGGMKGEVEKGMFEATVSSEITTIFSFLKDQRVLTWNSLLHNLHNGCKAWEAAGGRRSTLGENVKNELVRNGRNEQQSLAKLSDDALKTWVATFLLGAPSLGA